MTIRRESPAQAGGVIADTADAVYAFPASVQKGSMVWVASASNTTTDYVAGDCTKTAGTATLGSFSLDKAVHTTNARIGIWSALVTAAGTLTVTVANAGNSSVTGFNVYAGSFDSARLITTAAAATTTSTTPSSGNATSTANAVFGGVLSINNSGASTLAQNPNFTDIKASLDGTAHVVGDIIDQIVASGTTDAASWTVGGTPPVTAEAAVVVYQETLSGSAPTVTDVNTTEIVGSTSTGIVWTGTNFGSSQGSSTAIIVQGANYVIQTVTAWGATSITTNTVFDSGATNLTNLKYGAATATVNVAGVGTATLAISIAPPDARSWVDLTSINPVTTERLVANPDIAIGDQLEVTAVKGGVIGDVTLNSDGSWNAAANVTEFSFRVWASSNAIWGASAPQSTVVYSPPAPKKRRTYKVFGLDAAVNINSWMDTQLTVEKWFDPDLTPASGGGGTTAITGMALIASYAYGSATQAGALSGQSLLASYAYGSELGAEGGAGNALVSLIAYGKLTGALAANGQALLQSIAQGALLGSASISGAALAGSYAYGDLEPLGTPITGVTLLSVHAYGQATQAGKLQGQSASQSIVRATLASTGSLSGLVATAVYGYADLEPLSAGVLTGVALFSSFSYGLQTNLTQRMRVQAASAGMYAGQFYQPGDIFDIFSKDFSDASQNYQTSGGEYAPGWMRAVSSFTPLLQVQTIQLGGPFFPVIDPNRRFIL